MSRTNFDPQVTGFAFNNAWHLDKQEARIVRGTLFTTLLLVGLRIPSVSRRLSRFTLWIGIVGLILANLRLDTLVYGLCGGMAFTALDYYSLGWKAPDGFSPNRPTHTIVEGRILRDFIWKRTLDSLWANSFTFLKWMLILHFHPDHKRLLSRMNHQELARLKAHIDQGTPWPIGLIGTTWSPLNNHQVLAIGYDEDAPGGTINILVYDSNCPLSISKLVLDASEFVSLHESCFNADRGLLQGFFCEAYSLSTPPIPPKRVLLQRF